MSEKPEDSVEDPALADSSETPEGGSGVAEDLPDDVEVLKQRLKDTQKAFHSTREELSKTTRELDKLSGKVEVLANQKAPTEAEIKDWLEEFSDEDIQANPAKNKEIIKKLRGELGGVFKARDEWLMSQVKTMIDKSRSMQDIDVEAIEKLKADPDYEGFSEEQLAVIAKKTAKPAQKLPPSIGGRRQGSSAEVSDITKHPLYQKIYGDEG